MALSFKKVPFTTTFVDLLDINSVRQGLNCPAVRKFDDGSDYYTLPMLRDPVSGTVVGDSFDIANYLEDRFPDSGGCLFPADSTKTGLDYESPAKDTLFYAPLTTHEGKKNLDYAQFQTMVDATFSSDVLLIAQFMPFLPATADAIHALMAKRAHLPSWDVLNIQGEARVQLIATFKTSVESLAKFFTVNKGGPHLEGEKANYADLIVGGWLNYFSSCMPAEEWEDFKTWHGGVFGRLHDALQQNYFVV